MLAKIPRQEAAEPEYTQRHLLPGLCSSPLHPAASPAATMVTLTARGGRWHTSVPSQASPLNSLPRFRQNLVMFMSVLVDWMIPDIPTDISDQIKKEKSLLVDFFLKEEHEKLKLMDEPAPRSQGAGHQSRRSRAASSALSGRSQPGSMASSGSQHTNSGSQHTNV